jgi:hypothetical protein
MCLLYRELCPPVPEYRQVKCTVWCLLEACIQWKEWCFPVPAYRHVKCTAQYGVYWQCAYSRRSCALLYLDTGRKRVQYGVYWKFVYSGRSSVLLYLRPNSWT